MVSAIIRRDRGEQTGSRTTNITISKDWLSQRIVCLQWQTTYFCVHAQFCFTSMCIHSSSLPNPSPLSSLSYAPPMLLFSFGVQCCSSMQFVMLFEKLHFKQQKITFLCYVPSYIFLYLQYLMPICLMIIWVWASPPALGVNYFALHFHTFLSAYNFQLHCFWFGLEVENHLLRGQAEAYH